MKNKVQILILVVLSLVLGLSVFLVNYLSAPRPISPTISRLLNNSKPNWNSDLPMCGNQNEKLSLDFGTCQICKGNHVKGMGTLYYMFEGVKDDKCVFSYYNEVENPNWDGSLSKKCSVPTSVGIVEVDDSDAGNGYRLDEIKEYCGEE